MLIVNCYNVFTVKTCCGVTSAECSDKINLDFVRRTRTTTSDRKKAIERMRGLLKTNHSAPTNEEATAMLEERRVEKYLE
ncbi:MAG: hypothetical protein SW833_14070 [Cyanobacteriota bacterium]|nr:hypothetical protein [Cyanobacteriota bacterium]